MSAPIITRVLRSPSTCTFHQLHLIIQTAFDWQNAHLYKFALSMVDRPKSRRWPRDQYGIPHDPTKILDLEEHPEHYDQVLSAPELEKFKSSRDVKLCEIYENARWISKGIVALYEYDFGDCWDHVLHFMGRADPMLGQAIGGLDQQAAYCVAGEGRGAVEDCGGYPGYESLKELSRNPGMHHSAERRPWFREMTGQQTLDPFEWDIVKVNKDLKKLCRLNVYTK